MRDRLKDLEIISYFKDDNSYIFTAESSNKPLELEAFNRVRNQFIKESAEKYWLY